MTEINVKLTGWKALCVGGVIIAAFGVRVWTARQALDDKALEPIRVHLAAEYSGESTKRIREALRALDRGEAEDEYERMVQLDDIVFSSVSARGAASESIVRIEFTIRGAPPPHGDAVRYYRMEHSLLTGWRYPSAATWVDYYLAWFTLF